MRTPSGFIFAIFVVIISTVIAGCSAKQTATIQESTERSCIQGKVYYRISPDLAPVLYPSVTVSAWHHEKNQPLTETKTDQAGNFCIEVPLGNLYVDLRAWGMVNLPTASYTCAGSRDTIGLGSAPNRCGENCKKIEIVTDCKEFTPRRK